MVNGRENDAGGPSSEVGSRSPASKEAQEQAMSGSAGARASQTEGTGRQPEQTSNRRGAEHERAPEERQQFDAGQAPSEQGEKDHPSPHVIAQHQQGIGRQSGSHAGKVGDRSQERAMSGEPRGEHTRQGRQQTPGTEDFKTRDAD